MSTSGAYETLPYPCHTYAQTLPSNLAVIAKLHGIAAAPADACSVLEVGCGDGSNLLPMAWQYPQSTFHGIDPAAAPLAQGQDFSHQLGLQNLQLEACGVEALLGTARRYDYIIAHGFYSWVPDEVRAAFLQVCADTLNPGGVVFVSYNAYPGAHIRQMLREIMLFHAEDTPNPAEMIRQSRAMAGLLAETITDTADDYAVALRSQAQRVLDYVPEHLFHDDLSAGSKAFYLHEVVASARKVGLDYFGDADYRTMYEMGLPDKIHGILRGIPDPPLRHQYLDFFRARRFKQTLLCRAESSPSAAPDLTVVPDLYCGVAQIPSDGLPHAPPERDQSAQGLIIRLVRALCQVWPERLDWTQIHAMLGQSLAQAAHAAQQAPDEMLKEILVEAFAHGMIHLYAMPASAVHHLSEHPTSSAYAREQLTLGDSVTNLLHQPLKLHDAVGRYLVSLMDGTHTEDGLVKSMQDYLAEETDEPAPPRDALQVVRDGLKNIASLGLLQG